MPSKHVAYSPVLVYMCDLISSSLCVLLFCPQEGSYVLILFPAAYVQHACVAGRFLVVPLLESQPLFPQVLRGKTSGLRDSLPEMGATEFLPKYELDGSHSISSDLLEACFVVCSCGASRSTRMDAQV